MIQNYTYFPVLTLAVAVVAAAAAAVVVVVAVSDFEMMWRMVCLMSGRDDCCDDHGGCDVAGVDVHARESVRTGGWSLGIVVYPGPAGSVSCRSSWASSTALPWAAEV